MSELLAVAPVVLFAGLMGVGVIAYLIYGQKHREGLQEQTKDYRAGALAERLGLQVVRGDPAQNLWVTGTGFSDVQHFDVRLSGQKNGVPVDIVYFRDVAHEKHSLREMTIHSTWEVRLAAETNANFGHFEATIRNPKAYSRVRPFFDNPMPELQTGHPAVDQAFRLTGDNPAIAQALGPLLAPLTSLVYVHVVGAPGQVSFRLDRGDMGRGSELMGVAYGLYDAERILDVLSRIVLTAEGRAAA
ncbi:MAG: hypothetical protein RLO52_12320 [Sandaracinaceae bacterium]|nr:hypothetical protein [Myxococcales bacterium]